MRIRKLREDDIGEIIAIVNRTMGPGDAKLALADLKDTLSHKEDSQFKFDNFYVIEISRKIVAAGGVWALKHDPLIARLDWFMVHPDYQRKGLGSALINFMIKEMRKKKVRLILAETSSGKDYRAAVRFWEKNGFKEIAKIPNYWEDGSACLYFVRRL